MGSSHGREWDHFSIVGAPLQRPAGNSLSVPGEEAKGQFCRHFSSSRHKSNLLAPVALPHPFGHSGVNAKNLSEMVCVDRVAVEFVPGPVLSAPTEGEPP